MSRHSEHQAQRQPGRFPEWVETERLVLRRWHADDRAAVVDIWRDPDVWRAIGPGVMGMRFDADYAAGRFEHHLSHREQHGFGLWLAQERVSGQVAGWVGAAHPTYVPELAEAVEIAWTLRRPFWGQGLASEGANAAVQSTFAHAGVDEVISLINPTNARSISVAERLGMSPASDIRRPDTGEVLRVYQLSRPGHQPTGFITRGASSGSTAMPIATGKPPSPVGRNRQLSATPTMALASLQR